MVLTGDSWYLCAVNLHCQRPSSISASKVSHVTVNSNLLWTKLQRVHFAFGRAVGEKIAGISHGVYFILHLFGTGFSVLLWFEFEIRIFLCKSFASHYSPTRWCFPFITRLARVLFSKETEIEAEQMFFKMSPCHREKRRLLTISRNFFPGILSNPFDFKWNFWFFFPLPRYSRELTCVFHTVPCTRTRECL